MKAPLSIEPSWLAARWIDDRPDAMTGLMRWLAPAGHPADLARWRQIAGAIAACYLVVRAPVLLSSPSERFDGIGILAGFERPFRPPVLIGLWGVAVASTIALTLGYRLRAAAPIAGLSVLVLLTHRSSEGQILWFDILMVLHLLVLAAAYVGPIDQIVSGWALRLGALVTIVTYVAAGVAKLRIGGLDWLADGGLDRHIAFTATRAEVMGGRASPFAEPLVDLGPLSIPLAVGVVALELAAPVALLGRRWAWGWSALAWVMHAVIAATMFVVFHWPLLAAAFVPVVLSTTTRPDGGQSAKLAATRGGTS